MHEYNVLKIQFEKKKLCFKFFLLIILFYFFIKSPICSPDLIHIMHKTYISSFMSVKKSFLNYIIDCDLLIFDTILE